MAKGKKVKIKTKRGAKKRLRFTKSGEIKRSKAFGKHILTKKSAKRKRRIKKATTVSACEKKKISRLLPYG